jgi:hypothetical protein
MNYRIDASQLAYLPYPEKWAGTIGWHENTLAWNICSRDGDSEVAKKTFSELPNALQIRDFKDMTFFDHSVSYHASGTDENQTYNR